jgi:sugar/nucleoside kinase (ribokinase family)
VDVFKPNETEAAAVADLLGSPVSTDEEALSRIRTAVRPGGVVILTRGEAGALFQENREGARVEYVAAPKVPFRDATGAGDAFTAAYIFNRYVMRGSVSQAVLYGVYGGSFAVQHEGACDTLLTLDVLLAASISEGIS